jgi:hypothetical protein
VTVAPKPRTVRFGAQRGTRPILTDHAQLTGRTQVASFARYADAERTVDLLAHTYFPVNRLVLVGGELKLVTDVSGGITATRAATLGACGGLWIGALMVLFAVVVNRPTVGTLLVRLSWGLPLGAAFGAALGVSAYAVLGGARDLTSRRHLVATRHELHVDAEIATSTWRLLLKLHPSGMTLVDRVPAEVIAQPTELVLIETFGSAEQPAEQPITQPAESVTESDGRAEPDPAPQPPRRPVQMPASAL